MKKILQDNNRQTTGLTKKIDRKDEIKNDVLSLREVIAKADRCFLLKQFDDAAKLYLSVLPLSINGHAEFQLGVIYQDQNKKELAARFFRAALPKIQKHAESGDDVALCDLGIAYENGFGITEDKTLALTYYKTAAEEKGNARAQNFVGLVYDHGKGVPEDRELAVKYYHMAAAQGHVRALCNLGVMYGTGLGVTKDMGMALEFYKKSADQGYSQAQYNLGGMYFRGEGAAKDVEKASQLYKLAADQGHASAQCNLGLIYFNGYGIRKNRSLGLKYFQSAAEKGNPRSQFTLGRLYEKGNRVKKNSQLAFKYILNSADQGYPNAKELVAKIFNATCDDDLFLTACDFLAREWPQTHVRLNPSCRRTILEFFITFQKSPLQYSEIIPKELTVEMTRWIILVCYQKIKQEKNQNEVRPNSIPIEVRHNSNQNEVRQNSPQNDVAAM